MTIEVPIILARVYDVPYKANVGSVNAAYIAIRLTKEAY